MSDDNPINSYYDTIGTSDDKEQIRTLYDVLEKYALGDSDLPREVALAAAFHLKQYHHTMLHKNNRNRPLDQPYIKELEKDAVRYVLQAKQAGKGTVREKVANAYGLSFSNYDSTTLNRWIKEHKQELRIEHEISDEKLQLLEKIMIASARQYNIAKPVGTGNRAKPVQN